MTVVRDAALGLLVVILSLLLREAGFRGARLVSLVGIVLILGLAVLKMDDILDMLSLGGRVGEMGEELGTVLKIVGSGIVFGLIADAARDMGESGVSSAILVVGRVEIFAISVPYLVKLLDLVAEYFT